MRANCNEASSPRATSSTTGTEYQYTMQSSQVELFPTLTFRPAYDATADAGERADVELVRILHLVASTSQSDVERRWRRCSNAVCASTMEQ